MNAERSYPAKLLLFGEYTVLSGSRALALPLSRWQGILKKATSTPDQDLLYFSNYLEDKKLFPDELRQRFRQAIEEGLYFESNIPRGYGAGSSGALCAAIYDRFFADKADVGDILTLRQTLAAMEGCFHGTSSGMDPLVSLMNTPVLHEMDDYHVLPNLERPEGLQIFLLDSGTQRTTDNLVIQYVQWTVQESFQINCLRPLVQSVDHAISFLLDAHMTAFWEHLKLISQLQYDYFKPMITENISSIWGACLQHTEVAIKLCGAGGGGFYLGFTKSGLDIKALVGDNFGVLQVA
jgi:mevalonate kinase